MGPELGPDLISLVTTREEIADLLALDDVIDLVIPRYASRLIYIFIFMSGHVTLLMPFRASVCPVLDALFLQIPTMV